MELYSGGRQPLGNLRTPFQAGSAPPTESFVGNHHAAGIGLAGVAIICIAAGST